MMNKYKLAEMTWPEVEEALDQGVDTVVVTFGSTEQHGLHLPLCTDYLWGEYLGERVALQLGNALLAPSLRIGCSEHHMAFPGSITLSKETFIKVVVDYCNSLSRHGFNNIVLIPTHGGNFAPLAEAVESTADNLSDTNIIAYTDLMELMDVTAPIAMARGVTPEEAGAHAGEWETSMMMALRPELVAMDKAEAGYMGDVKSAAPIVFEQGFRALTHNGVLGDPEKADPKSGEAYLDELVDLLVQYVQSHRR